MSKTAKTGRKNGANQCDGIRGMWPPDLAPWDPVQRAPKAPWAPPMIPELPPLADRQAFEMHSRGMKQREITQEQRRSQATISRGISAVENWLAKTMPEDSGNLNAYERFRVGMARHWIYLEHLKNTAEKKYERSCETLKIERVRTKPYPEGRKHGGKLITETLTDDYPKHQLGRVSFLHFIDKIERQLAGLDAGWVGSGNKNISFDKVIDPVELDRWDRHVKWQQAQIAELQAKLAATENVGRHSVAGPSCPQDGGEQGEESTGLLRSNAPLLAESEIEKNSPDSAPQPPVANAPTPVEPKACDEPTAPELPRAQEAPKVNKTASKQPKLGWVARLATAVLQLGSGSKLGEGLPTPPQALTEGLPASGKDGDLRSAVSAGSETRAEPQIVQTPDGMLPVVKEPEEDPRPRWEDEYRQEALDYHCLIHGLPPASLEQATGIPDPKNMSPRMWLERDLPSLIYIDRSIPCHRTNPLDTRQVIKVLPPVMGSVW